MGVAQITRKRDPPAAVRLCFKNTFENGSILPSDCPMGNQQSGCPLRATNDDLESMNMRSKRPFCAVSILMSL
jgi:hypothetical protein